MLYLPSDLHTYSQLGAVFANGLGSRRDLEQAGVSVNGDFNAVEGPLGYGPAWDGDGTGDYLTVPTPFATGTYTVICWAKWDKPLGTVVYFIDARGDGVGTGYIQISVAGAVIVGDGTVYVNGVATTTAVAGQWALYAVTGVTLDPAAALTIGERQHGASKLWMGAVGPLIIVPGTLTAADIAAIHAGTIFSYGSKLVADWDFSSPNPQDMSGNLHHAVGTSLAMSDLTADHCPDGRKGQVLDGANDFDTVGSEALMGDEEQTWAGWVNNPADAGGYWFAQHNGSVAAVSVLLASGKMRGVIGVTAQDDANTDLRGTGWHVCGVSYHPTDGMQYYVDGDSDGGDASPTGTFNATIPLTFATRTTPVTGGFAGSLGRQVCIAKALTPFQHQHLFWKMKRGARI